MKKVILFFSVVALGTFLVLTVINSKWITEKARISIIAGLRKATGAEIEIQKINFGLFPPSAEISGIALKPLINIPRLRITMSPLQIFSGKLTIQDISIFGMQGTISFSGGKPRLPFEPPTATATRGPSLKLPAIIIKSMNVKEGDLKVTLDRPDLSVHVADFNARINPDLRKRGGKVSFSTGRTEVIYQKKALPDLALSGEGKLQGEELQWKALNVMLAGASLTLSGIVSGFQKPSLDLLLTGKCNLNSVWEILEDWIAKIPRLKGGASWNIAVSGTSPEIKAQGSLSIAGGGIGEFVIEDMDARFNVDRNRAEFDKVTLRNSGGIIRASGTIDMTGPMKTRALVETEGVSFARLLNNLTVKGSRVDSSLDVRASLIGALKGEGGFVLEGDADVLFKNFSVTEKSYQVKEGNNDILRVKGARVNTRIRIDDEKVRLSPANADLGTYIIEASSDLRYDEHFSISFSSDSLDLSSLSPIGPLPIRGKGKASGAIAGPFNDPVINGDVDMSGFGIFDWDLGSVLGKIHYYKLALSFHDMKMARGTSAFSGSGAVTFTEEARLSLNVSVPGGRLEDILGIWLKGYENTIGIKGMAEGNVFLEGPFDELNGKGSVRVKNAAVLGEMFSSGTASGQMNQGSLFVDNISLYKEDGSLSISGNLNKDSSLSVRLSSRKLPLTEINALRRSHYPISGNMSLDAYLGGKFRKPEVSANIAVRNVDIDGRKKEDSSISIDLKDGIARIEGNALGNEFYVDSSINLNNQGRYEAKARINNMDLAPVLWAVNKNMRLGGRATGTLEVYGSWDSKENSGGSLNLASLEIGEAVQGLMLINEGAISLEWDRRGWTVNSLAMKETQVSSGTFNLIGGFNERQGKLSAKGSLDLRFAALLLPSYIERSDGRAMFDIKASGPRKSPSLAGSISIRDGTLLFTGIPVRLESINAEAGLKGDTLTIIQTTGHAGKGEVSGKGNMKFSGLVPSNYDFSARMKNIDIIFARGVSGLFDGNIAFHGHVASPLLTGDIAIREARLTRWIDWQGLVLDKLLKKYRGDIRMDDKGGINLSVALGADRGIFVKNNLAQAELKGKGSIIGSVRSPSFVGSLEFIKGFIYYLDNKFDIKTGTINFSDEKELVPNIDVSAAALKKRVKDMRTTGGEIKEWKDYRILLHAYGRPDDLKIALSSEPSDLSEVEIHSVLAAGVIGGEEYGGIALGKATAYEFGRIAATRIVEEIGSMTIGEESTEKAGGLFRQAVDTIQLSPASDASTNATRLTVGKSWSERLEGSLSTELGGKGGGRADLKYTLNKYFSLIGSWDNDSAILMGDPDPLGNLGADIVFTLGFR